MTTEALKSPSITNLDATPITYNTVGEGAPGHLRSVSDSLTVTTGEAAGSTYRMVRFPTNAKVKHLWIGVDVTVTTFANDIDVAWSDSTTDGTPVAYQGTIPQISSADNKLFGAAVDLKSAGLVDYAKTLVAAKRNQPMWQALGYTSDPGGYFDILLKATSTSSGAPVAYAEIQYVL